MLIYMHSQETPQVEGGPPSHTPRSEWNSQRSGIPEEWNPRRVRLSREWNSQRSGIPVVPGGKTHSKVEFLCC